MSDENVLSIGSDGGELFHGKHRELLERRLPAYLYTKRWFGGKARTIEAVGIEEVVPFEDGGARWYILLLEVKYTEGAPETYLLPLSFKQTQRSETSTDPYSPTPDPWLYDATGDSDFATALLDAIRDNRTFGSEAGEVRAWHTGAFAGMLAEARGALNPAILGVQQSNSSIMYGKTFMLKLFRRLEAGTSPELEVGRFLGEKGFRHTPPLVGAIEYYRHNREPLTFCILQGYVANRGDAWSYTLGAVSEALQRVGRTAPNEEMRLPKDAHLLELAGAEIPVQVREAIGDYLDSARLLGRRTGEMHLALASGMEEGFAPEPVTIEYQHSLYEEMHELTALAFGLLRGRLAMLPEEVREEATRLLEKQEAVEASFAPLAGRTISAMRTRCHGDYHLGQALYTGDDFMIIDFEGEPARSLAERRQKHSPLKDVAGMLRSFDYAAFSGLVERLGEGLGPQEAAHLQKWANGWQLWVSAVYLDEYLATVEEAGLMPEDREELRTLLNAYLLEKAVYELVYELNNRPDWVRIPLHGIMQLLG